MISRSIGALALLLLSWTCFAAAPIATISSSQSIVISGITVPTNRVISWPVAENDEIVTQTAPATLRFTDGSTLTLQRNSRMRLQPGAAGVELKMLAGSAMYDLKPKAPISVGVKSAETRLPAAAAPPPALSRNERDTTSLAYRIPSPKANSGVVFAPSMFGTAAFAPALTRQANPAGARNMITLPNGLVLFVNPVSLGRTITGYTIIGVGADTQMGGVLPAPTVATLDGYTISVVNGPAGVDQVKIFPPGSGTPLTESQTATLVQTTLGNVNRNLPSGQQITTTTPGITIQPFSVSGT